MIKPHCVQFAFGTFWTVRTNPTTNRDKCTCICTAHVFRCTYTPYRNVKSISAAQLSRYKEDSAIGVTSLCRWYSTSRYGCVRTHAQALHTTRHGGTFTFPFSQSSLLLSLFLSLSFSPSISPFFFWHILFVGTIMPYYARFASRLSSLGARRKPRTVVAKGKNYANTLTNTCLTS